MRTTYCTCRFAAHGPFKAGRRTAGVVGTLLTLLNCALVAQETPPTESPPPAPAGGSQQDFAPATAFTPREGKMRAALSIDYSYVGSSQTKFQGTYRDFHLGAGVEYEIVRGLSLSVEGGYSVGRQIDYQRIDQTVSFDPAPYAQAGLRYRF